MILIACFVSNQNVKINGLLIEEHSPDNDQLHVASLSQIQVAFKIEMRDDDGNSVREIDTFDITATFPSDNQEQVSTGNRGIASITLTYDLICIDVDAYNTTVASSDVIGTCITYQ